MRKLHFLIAIVVVVLDRIAKLAIERNLPLHEGIQVIPGFFRITHVQNRGAAFGLFSDSPSEWKVALLILFSVIALVIYEGAFSPGPISSAHRLATVSTRAISSRPNAASCSNCHGVTSGMEDNCISCHRTATFQPTVYDAHLRENIACSSCHTEHQGAEISAGLVSYGLCSRCHNGQYAIKSGERAGSKLPIPHGGTVGYPVVDGKWDWKLSVADLKKRGLPDSWSSLSSTPKPGLSGI